MIERKFKFSRFALEHHVHIREKHAHNTQNCTHKTDPRTVVLERGAPSGRSRDRGIKASIVDHTVCHHEKHRDERCDSIEITHDDEPRRDRIRHEVTSNGICNGHDLTVSNLSIRFVLHVSVHQKSYHVFSVELCRLDQFGNIMRRRRLVLLPLEYGLQFSSSNESRSCMVALTSIYLVTRRNDIVCKALNHVLVRSFQMIDQIIHENVFQLLRRQGLHVLPRVRFDLVLKCPRRSGDTRSSSFHNKFFHFIGIKTSDKQLSKYLPALVPVFEKISSSVRVRDFKMSE